MFRCPTPCPEALPGPKGVAPEAVSGRVCPRERGDRASRRGATARARVLGQRAASKRTSVDRVHVVVRSARPGRSQAIISAGDGAAAAIDILSKERNEDVLDWDEPPKA